MVKTKRVKIHSNNSCNLKCVFCYYGDSSCIKEKDPSFEELKEQLRIARKEGALDVDFSGGEPTIVPFFPELIAYTKKLGYRTICVITNGLRMSKEDYVKKLVDAGLNDALFSLEGYKSKIHDSLTRVPGSFEKINKAIKNVKKSGIRCRINITVTKKNYKDLEKFAKHILKYKPDAVNFIKFNPWDVALNSAKELSPRYSEIEPYLKKAIDILNKDVIKITVRYIPYCFMRGYEKHVCNYLHLKDDVDEWWIPNIQHKMGKNKKISFRKRLRQFVRNFPVLFKLSPRDFLSFNRFVTGIAINKLYVKPKQCKRCKYYPVCDGIDKPYPKIYGTKEVVPIGGRKIKDPMFARGKYLEAYEKKHNF